MTAQPGSSSIRVGCSGWQYRHWRGDFYPAELPASRWLEHYTRHFDTVEINNTFYRLPDASTFDAWRRRAPARFLFAVKASRFLTHMKKLKDPDEPLDRLFTRASKLGRALGPVLYQLPPRWPVNIERLEVFLRALPKRRLHAIEFRDPTWYRADVFALLERYKAALCVHDMQGSASGRVDVGPFVYARFHGPAKYSGSYRDDALADWAEWMAARAKAGAPIFAYFNNDVGGHAPRDAIRLRDAIQQALR
jgi:uncharacterized protein YecE (DUF72 family)